MNKDDLGGFRNKQEMFDLVDSFLEGIPEFQKAIPDNIINLDEYRKNSKNS